jgi:antitoxin ParD1/3/4
MSIAEMRISLSPQMARFIRAKVKRGEYTDTSEVVRDALRRMQEAEATRIERALLTHYESGLTKVEQDSIRRGVQQGIKDIEQGRYQSYTLSDCARDPGAIRTEDMYVMAIDRQNWTGEVNSIASVSALGSRKA